MPTVAGHQIHKLSVQSESILQWIVLLHHDSPRMIMLHYYNACNLRIIVTIIIASFTEPSWRRCNHCHGQPAMNPPMDEWFSEDVLPFGGNRKMDMGVGMCRSLPKLPNELMDKRLNTDSVVHFLDRYINLVLACAHLCFFKQVNACTHDHACILTYNLAV